MSGGGERISGIVSASDPCMHQAHSVLLALSIWEFVSQGREKSQTQRWSFSPFLVFVSDISEEKKENGQRKWEDRGTSERLAESSTTSTTSNWASFLSLRGDSQNGQMNTTCFTAPDDWLCVCVCFVARKRMYRKTRVTQGEEGERKERKRKVRASEWEGGPRIT